MKILQIGEIKIVIHSDGRLSMFNTVTGEGGEFNMQKFAEHIRQFFNKEF